MSLRSTKILKISITINSRLEILEYYRKYLSEIQNPKSKIPKKTKKPLVIVTPNPEQIVYAQKDKHFAQILNRADIALPDGVGLVMAAPILQPTTNNQQPTTRLQRIPGVEFMEELVKLAAERGYPIALIGGRGAVAVEALDCLRSRYPSLKGWAEDGPEIEIRNYDLRFMNYELGERDYFKQLTRRISESSIRLIFVGFGAPKQEYFINILKSYFINYKSPLVIMTVGGSFDILSGRIHRAPLIWQAIRGEWLWRLWHEPWRWRRQLALLTFLWLVVKERLRK